jgi:hypothetical protein
MLRAAAIFVTLTIGISPIAAAVCAAECHPGAATSSGCPHQDWNSAGLLGQQPCTPDADSAAIIGEGARRALPGPECIGQLAAAVALPKCLLAGFIASVPPQSPPVAPPVLLTALRI